MRLRNKKTGEIVDTLCEYDITKGISFGVDHHDGNPTMACYNSLAELNEEWCDYEEPKEYWYVTDNGYICTNTDDGDSWDEYRKEVGNYFSSREEAEKAVERLRAWKRLKDKGFMFDGYDVAHKSNGNLAGQIFYDADNYSIEDVEKEMDLLFGGEE